MRGCVHACRLQCLPNEGLIGTLCACCETYQTILALESWGLEVCECPESVADWWNGLGRVLGGKNRIKLDWHLNPGSLLVSRKCRRPKHWLGECHRGSNQSLTQLAPEILKICECPEIVTGQWNGLGRVCVCVHACVCVRAFV